MAGGIIIESSSENTIVGNKAANNNVGIDLSPSSDNNNVYHNSIINNIPSQANDNGINNLWDNGYPSGGNYWDDFDEAIEGAYDDFNGLNQDVAGADGIVDLGSPVGLSAFG